MFIPLESPEILTTPYHHSVAWEGHLTVQELKGMARLPEELSAATPKRRTEFLAGRLCATKAIQDFHPDWTGQVGINPDGSPRWPEGLVGSITHTQGFASAAVAPNGDWLNIGMDSERTTEADVLKAAGRIVIREDERRLRARLPVPDDQFIALIFSAKESIYKCLNPLIKRSLDYSTVILDDIDYQNRLFKFHLSDSIAQRILMFCPVQGRFEFKGGFIHTGLELRRRYLSTSLFKT
jgi:enterobactin synthetase component D